MAFKHIASAATPAIDVALHGVQKEIGLVPYFMDTVHAIHEVALRQDPDTYQPLGSQFDTAAGVADHIIDLAVMEALERQDPDAERVLKRVCDQWSQDLGRTVPQAVTYQRGDVDRCAALAFPARYEF